MPHAIRVHRPGGPEVLQWEEVAVDAPGPGELLLRQRAVGLNFIDVYQRSGLYPIEPPFIPGMEGAGIVEAVGAGVTDLAVGDRVAYAGSLGSYAELRTIAAAQLVKLPDSISFDQAAAMMLQGMTAQMLIRRIHRVAAGETILIHAAAGGVGLIVCQWAAALGATVIGTVGNAEKAEVARAHGCTHPIDTSRQDFVAEVERITGDAKLPVVYDSVGTDTFLRSIACLRMRGMLVSFGQSSGSIEPFSPAVLAPSSLFLTRPALFHYIATRDELDAAAADLFAVVASGQVRIEINQRFALCDAAEAHRALEGRRTTGSTVLTV